MASEGKWMGKLRIAKIRDSGSSEVTTRTVRDSSGKAHRVRVIDVNSKTFSSDLLSVFKSNVSRERRKEKQLAIAAEECRTIFTGPRSGFSRGRTAASRAPFIPTHFSRISMGRSEEHTSELQSLLR